VIPVDQQHPADPGRPDGRSATGRLGDCLRACIASVTELPYHQVPHFAEHGPRWWDDWRTWSRAMLGCDVGALVPIDGSIARYLPGDPAAVVAIANGPSPRRREVGHAVVVDGLLRLLHDPHPSRAGVPVVEEVYLFVPLDVAAAAVT
jgi:hypothetical protein